MRLEPVGRVDNPETLDKEPIVIPVIGYTATLAEVETEISFVGDQPAGASLDIIRAVDADGNVNARVCLLFVDNCVHPDSRKAWEDLLHRPDVKVSQETLIDLYIALGEAYSSRPSVQRSGSRAGRGSTKPTSRVVASAQKSASKTSR